MGSRSRLWLCALAVAYAVTSLFMLYVYETYVRSYVIGDSSQESFTANNGYSLVQRRTAAASMPEPLLRPKKPSVQKKTNYTRPIHTCQLHGETISLPMAPDLILAGAMKSGTTYFWTLLRGHPDFVPPIQKFEAHFFDWNFAVPPAEINQPSFWNRFENAETEEEFLCAARKQYMQENFNKTLSSPNDKRLTYEKTPNYMFLPQVPELIHKVCPWKPKILLILRNPVDRAYSHYVMDASKDHAKMSFEEYIDLELQTLRKQGLSNVPNFPIDEWGSLDESKDHLFEIPDRNRMTEEVEKHKNWRVYRIRHMRNYLHRGMYIDQLKRWNQYFPLGDSLMVINNDRLVQYPREVMTEVMTWLGVPKKDYFLDPNVPVTFGTDGKQDMKARGLSNHMKSHLSVGGNKYEPMSNATRHFLEKFYKPYNAELAHLLGEEWDGVWVKK